VSVRRDWAVVLLGVLLLASAVALLLQPPFAFYSPDVSYHTGRILRAGEGDWFRDPWAGTFTIYPSLFHVLWGGVQRATGVDTIQIARAGGVLNIVATFAGFFFLALQLTRDRSRAALATLALGAVLLAPTGRYVLLLNPVNFTLAPLFTGFALLARFLESGRLRDWMLGLALCAFAANVNWYQVLCVAGFLAPLAWRLFRAGRLSPRTVAWGALAFAVPCLWTALHFWTIRPVLPAYRTVGTALGWSIEWSVLRDCVVTYVTHWNLKFLPQAARSTPATVLWYAVILPVTAVLLVVPVVALARPRLSAAIPDRAWLALQAALGVFLGSLAMTLTHDLARVAWIQFVSFAFVVLFAIEALAVWLSARLAMAASSTLATAGVACLAYTVLHSPGEPALTVSGSTQAVIDFIESQPGHQDMFIFTTEQSTRRLGPFVSFRTFVNHRSGFYVSQDPVSAREMLAAYESILAHDAKAGAALARYGVRFLAFRHRDVPRDAELAALHAPETEVALRNREWVVLRTKATDLSGRAS
jgi:hypothetical protein